MMRTPRILRTPWTAVVALLLAICGPVRADEPSTDYVELFKVFVDTFEQIERNYVKPVDRRELVEAAMQGMLSKLDPYSSYIDPDELKQFNTIVDQEFGGVGIQVTVDEQSRQLMVSTPLPGTPAFKAGIRAGDRIVEIDGQPTADFPGYKIDTAVRLMRGKPGEKVKVKVLHEGAATPVDLEIERAIIRTATVLGDRYDDEGNWIYFLPGDEKIAYLRLTHFSRNSAEEMQDALETVTEGGLRGLILDLRSNPGGLLTAATAIADMFVESGDIVSTKGRNTETQTVKARKPGTFTGFPMAVLVNRYSASASEIVSACLQDHKRAVVIGERTWGKGSVQNVIEMENGKSALKLTTASYHRPSGKNIHRFPNAKESDDWGVMPDNGFAIESTPQEREGYARFRAEKDVFRPNAPQKVISFQDRTFEKSLDYVREELKRTAAGQSKPAAEPKDGAKTSERSAPGAGRWKVSTISLEWLFLSSPRTASL